MPIQAISDLDDAALLEEYRRSIRRLQSLDRAAPVWTHDIRLMYHDYLADEVAARRLRIDVRTVFLKPAQRSVEGRSASMIKRWAWQTTSGDPRDHSPHTLAGHIPDPLARIRSSRPRLGRAQSAHLRWALAPQTRHGSPACHGACPSGGQRKSHATIWWCRPLEPHRARRARSSRAEHHPRRTRRPQRESRVTPRARVITLATTSNGITERSHDHGAIVVQFPEPGVGDRASIEGSAVALLGLSRRTEVAL